MAAAAVLYLSRRLQTLSAAVLCLLAVQTALAACTPEPVALPMGARVAIGR